MTETEDVLNHKVSELLAKVEKIELSFAQLLEKVEKLEERLNLLMALRQNKLDLSKFIFQLEPL
jgi:hypothetical protein